MPSTELVKPRMQLQARQRLLLDYRRWLRERPPNFRAGPVEEDGFANLMRWECGIPGKDGTIWEGGLYRMFLEFPPTYPREPPRCRFDPPLLHPNLSSSGIVVFPPSEETGTSIWIEDSSVKDILCNVQDILHHHHSHTVVNSFAHVCMKKLRAKDFVEKARHIAMCHPQM